MTEKEIQFISLDQAFSPSSPISEKQFFSGRISEIDRVVDSINERGQHVIVHGERGVGKTSFANIIGTELSNVCSIKITCNRNDTFKGLWEKAFAKVQFERTKSEIGFIPAEKKEQFQLDLFIPDTPELSALDIQLILEQVAYNLL